MDSTPPRPTLVERVVGRVRKNPVFAAVVVLGIVVVWLANFTEAVKKLRTNLPGEKPAMVSGRWESGPLKDVRTTLEYRYVFELKAEGGRVSGTAQRRFAFCENKAASGICTGHGRRVPIVDGRIDRTQLAFACDWGELPAATPWAWINVKETFRGTVDGKTVRLVQQDDQNSQPMDVIVSAKEPTTS